MPPGDPALPRPGVDHAAVLAALPTPYLLLSPDLTILEANRAYLAATGRTARDLAGAHLFEAFPDDPDDPDANSTRNLRESLDRALRTGRADTMPVQRYNIPDGDGGFQERWWSPVNIPVLDDEGRVRLLVHRVEDVTTYVATLAEARRSAPAGVDGPVDPGDPAVDLVLRGHELRDALTEESVAALRLNGLVEVARQLGAAEDLDELVSVVMGRGMRVMGADGGAVGVIDPTGEGLDLTVTEGLPQDRVRLALTDALPASTAARTGVPVVLPHRTASLAWSPEMADTLTATGLVAWVALPLAVGSRRLGSLTVGWRTAQELSERDLQLMEAFAALCAQALLRLRSAHEERRRAAAERAMLTELQLTLLAEPHRPPGLDVAVRYLPSAEDARIGGDWYDSFPGPSEVLNVVIGDVAGHDRHAAAAMAQLRNLLRGVSVATGSSPAAALAGLEQAMLALEVDTFATAVLAQVEVSPRPEGGHRVRWSNAGHPPPVLLHPDGRAEALGTRPELLLGVRTAGRTDHVTALPAGASLLLYTDGLVEDRTRSLRHGVDRLLADVTGRQHLCAEELLDHVLATSDTRNEDDIALLVVRADPAP